MKFMLTIALLSSFFAMSVKCQEDQVFILEHPTSPDEQQGGFSSHIVALRPDYTFWKMVNVLKTVFDSRTPQEKRRGPMRRDAEESAVTRLPSLRSRRLLLNFGRYRV
ncbi:Protein CBG23953 [Caenorhabditis briggsae]|uniref:Protein CBG23953 n=1 Tax=Caenorhabditis briggsae TaxID=6238 RepID=A8WJN4_CAEBR|nr:Protein CBG23953 [Caenorhabditis briggsae]CAP20677.1 Protein CBG23953 [Caenorhabditis briggsae]